MPRPAPGAPGSGVTLDPAWSPDGSLLAYVKAPMAETEGWPSLAWYDTHDLMVWDVKTRSSRRVAGVTGASVPEWSASGKDLLFVKDNALWLGFVKPHWPHRAHSLAGRRRWRPRPRSGWASVPIGRMAERLHARERRPGVCVLWPDPVDLAARRVVVPVVVDGPAAGPAFVQDLDRVAARPLPAGHVKTRPESPTGAPTTIYGVVLCVIDGGSCKGSKTETSARLEVCEDLLCDARRRTGKGVGVVSH